MRPELPVFSFLSIALLILILPGQAHSYSILSVSIMAWLFLCNLIHGINSVLWSGNQAVHAPVWCDISSVVLLGAMVALPSCFLCISRRLEAITSIGTVEQRRDKTYRNAFEAVMCLLLPALYMSLHTIVQDRRFVILEDYGCQAAVHDSLPALIIVWLPPLCISIIGTLYSLSAVINVGKYRYNSSHYFPSAPEITSSLFVRRIVFAMSGLLYVAAAYVYALSSVTSSGLLPWISVSQTRSQIMNVEIVPASSQMSVLSELIWWFIPVWSLLLCILSVFGEETQRGYHSTFTWLSQRFRGVLPLHKWASAKTVPVPVHLLRSGWDHDLDLDSSFGSFRSNRFSYLKKAESTRSSTPSPPLGDEAPFAHSTINYLVPGTAQKLHSPSPPPINILQDYVPFVSPPNNLMTDTPAVPATITDGDSFRSSLTGSIFSADTWPRPPPTIHSPVSSRASTAITDPRCPSSPLSSRSSFGSTIVDALGAIPAHLRDTPFNANWAGVTTAPTSQRPREYTQHRSSSRKGSRKNEAIYMTVVHETLAGS